MAIRMLTPAETGQRVAEVRRRIGIGSVEISLAMGRGRQWWSRIETGRRKTELTRAEKWEIAQFASGKKDFVKTEPEEIFRFLEGDLDWEVRLRPNHLRPVDGGSEAQDEATTEEPPAGIGYFRQTQPDLRELLPTGTD